MPFDRLRVTKKVIMGKKAKQIGEVIEDIALMAGGKPVVFTGIVKSVNESAGTCDVALNVNTADVLTKGVQINTFSGMADGMICVPAVNSVVWVAALDGTGNKAIIRCSSVSKVLIKTGSITIQITSEGVALNGTDLGGIVKVQDLVNKLNNLEQTINQLMTLITGWTPVPGDGGLALKTALASWCTELLTNTVVADLENTNVKHG